MKRNKRESGLTLLDSNIYYKDTEIKIVFRGFPGGTVVKNPSANAGDTGLSPGQGRSHMPRSN